MSDDRDELLARIAQLPESERHRLMVELGRRYGLPDQRVVAGLRKPSHEGDLGALADYRIVFGAVSRGGPRGSYLLSATAGGPNPVMRVELGERIGEAEAEYDTLIAALQDLLARIGAAGHSAEQFTVEVCTEDELVISQIQGTWKTRDERVQKRCDVTRHLLERFHGYRIASWEPEQLAQALGGIG